MTRRSPHDLAALAVKPVLNRSERRAAAAYLRKRPDLIAAAHASLNTPIKGD